MLFCEECLRAEIGIKQPRRHLRQFPRVCDEAGKRLIFRYNDPRVLRVDRLTCRPAEIDAFFGPVRPFVMEGEDQEEILEFRSASVGPSRSSGACDAHYKSTT